MSKKVVVIGSGLGGLTTGVVLAKNGYEVTVLEQGVQVGGCLQCFVRRGEKFETGMHFIGSAEPGQTLDNIMRYLEIRDAVTLSPLAPDGYDVVSMDGKKYKFAKGRQAFIDQMCEYFPSQRTNLEHYYDLVEMIANASSLHSLKYAETDDAVNMEYQLRSIDEVISSTITDPVLAKVLVGQLPLYAAELGKTPFSIHAFIMDFYNQSAFRVVGGSDRIAEALVKTIEKYGGSVLVRKKVTTIECDDKLAKAVLTEDGCRFDADYVISTAHPKRTLEMLGDTQLIRAAYRKRVNAIPETMGCFTLYLHFKENAVPYMNSNYYSYREGTPWNCEIYDDTNWPKGYLYMHLCSEPDQKWARTAEVLSYMHIDELKPWLGTKVGRRGKDYEAFKARKQELLLAELEKEFPGIRDNIEYLYSSTPLTYFDYTGTEGGSMYGIAKDVSSGPAYRVSHRTRIPNVLMAGQNVNSHGMLGVLVGTIVACSELLTSEKIYKQIIEANA